MPGVITRGFPHLIQPQYPPEIDWSNPLNTGLIASFESGAGGGFTDVSKGRLPVADNSTDRVGTTGKSRDYAGTQNTQFINTGYGLAGALTIIVACDVDALTNYSPLVANTASNTTNGWELRIGSGASDSVIMMHRANTNFKQNISSSDKITAGSKNNFIAVTCVDGDIGASPSGFVNGSFFSMPTATGAGTGAAVANSSTVNLYIGSRADGVTMLDGAIQFVRLWDRVLSNDEILALYANPWQIFAPQKRNIWVGVAGGGAVNADHTLAFGYLENISNSAAAPFDYASVLQTFAALPIGLLSTARADAQPPIDWLAGIVRDAVAGIEYRGSVTADSMAQIDYAGLLRADVATLFEHGLTARADHVSLINWLATLQRDSAVPVEWTGGVLVTADAALPIEWRSTVSADGVMPVSISQVLAVNQSIPVEFSSGVVRDQAAVLEWLASIGANALMPLSTIAVVRGDQTIMAEWGGTAAAAAFVSGNINVFHLDARGTVWHLDARGTVWKIIKH